MFSNCGIRSRRLVRVCSGDDTDLLEPKGIFGPVVDDQFGVFNLSVQRLGEAAKRWPDDLVTAALIAGITALCYDGQPFFSSAHPVDIDDASQGTFSNRFDATTSGALPLNVGSSYLDNFAFAYAQMMAYKGESGVQLEVQPTVLMVPIEK